MARSVADCAMFTAAVSNNDFGDPDRKPDAAPRIGLCPGPYGAVADAATMALLEDAAHRLSAAGAMVVQRPLPEAYAAMVDAHPLMQNAESAASMAWELATHRDAISPGLCHNLESAMAKGGDALTAARATITDLKARFAGVMDGVDILLTPSACGEAPCGIEWTGDPAFNSTWTALHVPCVTVPAGTGPAGLPLGIQIVGPVWSDRATLAWAQWVAAALG
jgi:Asp-tRNA(Asn)/Glu-tRNA(Gln) amidotransferase A subunit family amidase